MENDLFVQPGASARRVARLRQALEREGLDAFLVCDTSDIMWLSAFDGVFDDEAAHALLVTRDAATLHTDSRYSTAARAAAASEGVVEVNDERVGHAAFAAAALSAQAGGEASGVACGGAAGAGRCELGIEDSLPLSRFRALERAFGLDDASDAEGVGREGAAGREGVATPVRLRETSDVVLGLRAVKEPCEIRRLKAAQAVTDAAFDHITGFIRTGMTEREVQIELEDFMRRHGADGLAFSSIVATGANGANPHAVPGRTRLEAGQCVVIDFGARAWGYCSDMTRTVFLGRPSERLAEAYAAIREANERVEAALAPGVTGRAMHELAEEVLAERGFAGRMGHGLGHGVGIDIHEQPALSPRNEKPLEQGNVVTVEPGVYLPGEFGMRLEDCGVLTDAGFEPFTRSTHEMVVL